MGGSASKTRGAFGFSTIEVLTGSSLLLTVLIGLAGLLPTSERSVHLGGQNTKAAALAQQLIEAVRNEPFSQIALYNGANGQGVDTRNPGNFPVDTPNPPVPGNPGNFQGGTSLARWANDIALVMNTGAGITGGYGTVLVQTVATDGGGNSILDKVTVTVFWSEDGAPRSLQLSTLVSGI
jgi:hypothetical protein